MSTNQFSNYSQIGYSFIQLIFYANGLELNLNSNIVYTYIVFIVYLYI